MRKNSLTKLNIDDTSQCGHTKQGGSGFAATPGSKVEVKWQTLHSDPKAMCRLRLSEGFFNDNESYEVLNPHGADAEGWFRCGRRPNSYELKQVNMPEVVCDLCTLQLEFNVTNGVIRQCSDISLLTSEYDCTGLCKNGGS